ncbi:MAG: hypothetical protein CMM59_14890 [Rhodospirillaceae bacterium]|nr:hypothetical protein [Rhodospirillaceae bacterium]
MGYGVATVSSDTPSKLARFAKRRQLKFSALADPDADLIRAFDVLDEAGGYGLPHPIIFVMDPAGKITHRFSRDHYTDRPPAGQILQVLRGR